MAIRVTIEHQGQYCRVEDKDNGIDAALEACLRALVGVTFSEAVVRRAVVKLTLAYLAEEMEV